MTREAAPPKPATSAVPAQHAENVGLRRLTRARLAWRTLAPYLIPAALFVAAVLATMILTGDH